MFSGKQEQGQMQGSEKGPTSAYPAAQTGGKTNSNKVRQGLLQPTTNIHIQADYDLTSILYPLPV
jgi:hypothetical protein